MANAEQDAAVARIMRRYEQSKLAIEAVAAFQRAFMMMHLVQGIGFLFSGVCLFVGLGLLIFRVATS